MSYFATWNEKIEDNSDQKALSDFVERYYALEQEAYRRILSAYPERQSWSGSAAALQEELGFDGDMVIFLGFLDGIQESIAASPDLDAVDEQTELTLEIDFEKLLYNMHAAGAKWLFGLDAWSQVFSDEERERIARDFRRDHIAVRDENRVGRNEPCPCGSGKKYKNCCARKAGD